MPCSSEQEEDDLSLLTQWCQGSDAAGDRLLRRCFPALYRFFINKVGDATEDLVQQTLMGCVLHRERMLEAGTFQRYMFRIARSRLYDYLRAQIARNRNGRPATLFPSRHNAGARSTTSVVSRGRAASEVLLSLRKLSIAQQVVVELHYWEGMSTAEIASALEIAQGTVKSRLRRARSSLEVDLRGTAKEVFERLGGARPAVTPGS